MRHLSARLSAFGKSGLVGNAEHVAYGIVGIAIVHDGLAACVDRQILQPAACGLVGVEGLRTVAVFQVGALLELVIADAVHVVIAIGLVAAYLLQLTAEVVGVSDLLLVRVDHLQEAVVAVVGPLRHIGGNRLVGHNQRAAGLGDFAHLAVEVFDGSRSVLTEHQATDAVLRGVASAVVILYVVLRVVGIVDARQPVIIVVVGDGLAFLGKVGSLLGQHIAECIIGEGGDAACRMVHLGAAVAHIIYGGRHVAFGVGDSDQTVDAVILEGGGDFSVRTAELLGHDGLAAAVGIGSLLVAQSIDHGSYQCTAACIRGIGCQRLGFVGKGHFRGTVEYVIHRYGRRYSVKCLVEVRTLAQLFRDGIVSFGNTSECVIDIASADNHYVLCIGYRAFGCRSDHAVLLHLHGPTEAVHKGDGFHVIVRMLDVVVLRHGVCRGGDAVCRKFSLRVVFECNNIRYTRSQLVRAAYSGDASEVVHIGLVVEVVQVAAFLGDAVAVIEIACLASVAERIFHTFHIHVHFRFVAVLIPHALSLGIGRKCLLQDVAEAVITVVGDGFAVSELLRYPGQVVRVLRVIYRRYLVVDLSVPSGHGHIGRQSEDVPAAVGGIADGGLVVKLAVTLAAELALVAEPVGFQLTVVAGEVIFIPCLRGDHSLSGTFVLQVRRIAERYEG